MCDTAWRITCRFRRMLSLRPGLSEEEKYSFLVLSITDFWMTNGSCFKWACLDAAWKNQLERKWQIDMQRIFKFYSYLPQNTFVQVRIKVSSFFLMCLFTLKFFRFRLRLSFISKLLWPNFANNSTPPRYSKNIRYSAIKNSTSLLKKLGW